MSRAVIDQPGVRIVFIGLVLALVLGLAIKAQISDERIHALIDKSINRLQADFTVDYESAQVNLSNWGMPLPALYIKNIRFSPKQTQCQSSQIFISELQVPISISAILGIDKRIPKIRLKEIELRVSDLNRCFSKQDGLGQYVDAENSNGEDSKIKNDEMILNKTETDSVKKEIKIDGLFTNETRAELNEIFIEKLIIILKDQPEQPILLKQLGVELFYADKKLSEVKFKSKVSSIKDSKSDIYFLSATLNANIKAQKNGEFEFTSSIEGKLLDGDIRLFAHSFSNSNKISYEFNVNQVSAKVLYPFFHNFNFGDKLFFEKTPITLSFLNQGEVYFSKDTAIYSKFKKIQINVEEGFLSSADIELSQTDSKVKIKPFELTISSFPLSKLKYIDAIKKKLESFENIGSLSGVVLFKAENNYSFKGQIKNIQTVFSNRGRRDLQSIEQVDVQINRNGDNFKLIADKFNLNGNKVVGKLDIHHDASKFITRAQFRLDGVSLNNKVWEQFTYVAQSPKISILWNFNKSIDETHDVDIRVDKVLLPGIKIDDLSVKINQTLTAKANENKLFVSIKPTHLSTDASLSDNKVIGKILNPTNGYNTEHLSSTKAKMEIRGQDWKDITFNLDLFFSSDANSKNISHLKYDGSVVHELGLNSKLVLLGNKHTMKFELKTDKNDDVQVNLLK